MSAQQQLTDALSAVWDPLKAFLDAAATEAPDAIAKYEKMNGFKRGGVDGYITAYGGFNVKTILNELIIDNTWLGVMSDIWELMLPLGLCLLLINFLLQVNEEALSKVKEFDFKILSMLMIKLFAGVAAVYYGPNIIAALCEMSNAMIYYVLNNSVGIPGTNTISYGVIFAAVVDAFDKLSLLEIISLIINIALLNIMGIIPKIEIILRGGLACVALPDIFNDARRSLAVTYIKKLAVCMMQGAFMIVICNVVTGIQMGYLQNVVTDATTDPQSVIGFGVALRATLYGFAACGLCAGVKPILNDMLGV